MLSRIETIRKEKKIGLLIHNKVHLFSNGLFQNAFFLFRCFEHIGLSAQLLCLETDPAPLQNTGLSLKQISTDPSIFNASDYHTIVTCSRGLPMEIFRVLKEHKVHVVAFGCGISIMIDMEEFVHGPWGSSSGFVSKKVPKDEVWTIPNNEKYLNYISLLRDTRSFVVPHVWSPEINRISNSEEKLLYNYSVHNPNKINLLVTESNINLCKNAWLPIIAAEWLNKYHPDLIESVYIFNFPKHGHAMIDELDIKPKLKKFARLAMPEILTHFNQQAPTPIFISYQMNCPLNYSYYESLYFGYPLVHNSSELDGNGYFYRNEDIVECANQILYAATHHNKTINTYMEKGRTYLKKIDPENKDVGAIYSQLINEGIRKSLTE
jgi:hypothetical protein